MYKQSFPYLFSLLIMVLICGTSNAQFKNIPLQSTIANVQPMTGMVLWMGSDKNHNSIQMEYSYMKYDDVVKGSGVYDWTAVESKLNSVAGRSHQSILRFWDTYPGKVSGVPAYIKALPDYKDITANSEGRATGFPDWSHPEYQRFMLEFFQKFAEKYDNDPRLAFLQVGFGLWSEYHIYDPGEIVGTNFPSKEFQTAYFRHLDTIFKKTPWMISQDAQISSNTPFAGQKDLLNIQFGIFDDSFTSAWSLSGYNYNGWKFFGLKRYESSPAGGEILFANQAQSDLVDTKWAAESRIFGMTFMIVEQWLQYINLAKLKVHSMECGYQFEITSFQASADSSIVQVKNNGVAPIYYDAFIALDGVRSTESLIYLKPDETKTFGISKGGVKPVLTIACDRLVPGQKIEFSANLTTGTYSYDKQYFNKGFNAGTRSEAVIYSAQGKVVAVQKGGTTFAIPELNLTRGVYFIAIRNGGVVSSVLKKISID